MEGLFFIWNPYNVFPKKSFKSSRFLESEDAICDICGKALLTASAEVNGKAVQMTADGQSANAIVPLTVINTAGFTLPKTGGNGMWMYAAIGVLAIIGAGTIVIVYRKKRKNRR